jgi:hypothetical protein
MPSKKKRRGPLEGFIGLGRRLGLLAPVLTGQRKRNQHRAQLGQDDPEVAAQSKTDLSQTMNTPLRGLNEDVGSHRDAERTHQ